MIDFYLEHDLSYRLYKKEKRTNGRIYLRAGMRMMLDVQSKHELARYMRVMSRALERGEYNP